MSPIVVPAGLSPNPTPESLQLGRLLIGPPLSWEEPNADPIGSVGGAVVAAARQVCQAAVCIATMAADGHSDTPADRMRIRRQLRSLLNNQPVKLSAFFYVIFSGDPDQDGWWAPAPATFQDPNNGSAPATGFWQVQSQWSLLGHRRTHREARQAWMKDLRAGGYDRDTLGWIRSTDFSGLPALALSVLPNGASQASLTVSGQAVSGAPLAIGRDGGQSSIVQGLSDLQVVSYERAESALNLSDVIVYDRRGQLTAPSSGPDTSWEEVYGPDYPWAWQASGGTADCPVLDNGLVRVRWDSANTPGFRIGVWNGSQYVEQGKVNIQRIGDSTGALDTWVSAGLHTDAQNGGWTPERAVLSVVLTRAADPYSFERVYITMRRGETGVTFEVYPALLSTGAQADARLVYTMNGPDSNDSIMFEPSRLQPPGANTDNIWGTASSNWMSAIGVCSSSTANFVSILRCIGGASTVGPYQVNLAVVQQSVVFDGSTGSAAYGGAAQNTVRCTGQGGSGYLQVQIGYVPTQPDQVQGTSSTWTSSQASQYRVFGLAGSAWTDYGEYTGTTVPTGSSSRLEVFQTQDRTRSGAVFAGARDFGQAALYDSRMLGALTVR